MRLKALNLKGVIFDGDIISANLKTQAGEITILDHHRPLVSVLSQGEAVFKKIGGEEKKIKIKSGFLEMSPDNMLTLLVD